MEDVAEDILRQGDQVVGSTPDHRAQVLRLGNSAHINYNPTVVTHFHSSMDTAFKFSKSTKDRQIFFQLIRVAGMSMLLQRASAGEDMYF